MSHYEIKGYLVRRGKTVYDCGFILPKDRKEYLKANKPKKVEPNIVDLIRKELSRITQGKPDEYKKEVLYKYFNTTSFNQIYKMDSSELKSRLSKLRGIS